MLRLYFSWRKAELRIGWPRYMIRQKCRKTKRPFLSEMMASIIANPRPVLRVFRGFWLLTFLKINIKWKTNLIFLLVLLSSPNTCQVHKIFSNRQFEHVEYLGIPVQRCEHFLLACTTWSSGMSRYWNHLVYSCTFDRLYFHLRQDKRLNIVWNSSRFSFAWSTWQNQSVS